jgi:hypothetical protein
MKCRVIVDEKGKIVSVGYGDPPEPETEEALTLKSGPVVLENQRLVELDIPEKYMVMPTADLIQRLQIDIKAKRVKTRK